MSHLQRWPQQRAYIWHQAPFLRLLLPFMAAIIAYDVLARGHGNHLFLPSLALIAGLFCILCFHHARTTVKAVQSVALLLLLGCLGWQRSAQEDISNNRDWPGYMPDTACLQLVTVLGEPIAKDRIWKIPVLLVKRIDSSGVHTSSGLAFLNCYKNGQQCGIQAGDQLLVPARWQLISNAGNPFEFDYAALCRRRNTYYQQFVAPGQIAVYRRKSNGGQGFIERLHDYCQQSLDTYLRDKAARGLMQAMLLGDERDFDPELRQAYADTGVVHIVSISGSHVAVLFLLVTSLLFWVKGRSGQWVKYLTGLCLVWLYVIMAGAPPSAVRAAVMFSVIALGVILAKQPSPLNTVLGAAFTLLFVHPVWLFHIGFQLSFLAVLSLLYFYQPLVRSWSWPHGTLITRWLWQGICASLAAELLVAPLCIFYFHNFPLFFLPANLLAALLLGVLALGGGIGIIVFRKLAFVAKAITWCLVKLVHGFNDVILVLQQWNPESFRHLQLTSFELILCYAAISCFAAAWLQRKRNILPAGLISLTSLILLLSVHRYQALSQDLLIVYNTGRRAHIERIVGNRYIPLRTDTSHKDDYLRAAAHNGFGAWRTAPQMRGYDCFRFKGRTVLQLADSGTPSSNQSFPVDVLLIARPLKGLQPAFINACFHPGQIVLATSQPRYLTARWRDSCSALGIGLHCVTEDGAFLLN